MQRKPKQPGPGRGFIIAVAINACGRLIVTLVAHLLGLS
jgi:hypothetical protein